MSLEIIQRLKELEDEGIVSSSEYKDLILFNYTDKCTFQRRWDKYTLEARGTIYNKNTGEITARAFSKFFNLNENGVTEETLPQEPFVATIKEDGSMGTVFMYEGELRVATRGSFYSSQAIEATKMANEEPYRSAFLEMLQLGTPLVEIIFPENKIIVDYGNQRKLVVLAIRKLDGTYVPIKESENISHIYGLQHTMIIDNSSLEELKRLQSIISWQEEGWVLVYESGYRVKIKGLDYLRIAKIKSCLSPLSVWEAMKENKAEEYIASIPDEIHTEASEIYKKLKFQLFVLKLEVLTVESNLGLVLGDFKNNALLISSKTPNWMHAPLFTRMRGQNNRSDKYLLDLICPTGNSYINLSKFVKENN